MQLLPESGNVRSPLPDSGEHVWPDPAKIAGLLRIRSDPAILAKSDRIHPDPTESVARSIQIRLDSVRSGWLLNMAGIWFAGIRRRQYFGGRML
jgi:hypothetical protein